MKKLLLFFFFSVWVTGVSAQYYKGIIYPVYKNGKMGYIDNTGYLRIFATEEPVYWTQLKDITQAVYSPVYKDFFGLYDRVNHKMLLDYKYESVTVDEIHKLVRIALPFYKTNSFGAKNYAGFVDFTGKEIIPPKYIGYYNSASSHQFSEGLWAFASGTHDKWLKGYMDTKGKIVVSPRFEKADDFSNGLAVVQYSGSKKKGAIDRTGRLVIDTMFQEIKRFSKNGYAFAQPGISGSAYVVIDKKGKVVKTLNGLELQPGFGSRFTQDNGYCRVYNRTTKKMGFVTDKGDIAIPVMYEFVNSTISDDLIIANIGGKESSSGFTGGKWTLLNTKGVQLFSPVAAEKMEQQGQGMAAIKINGKWGFINSKGQMVVQPQWTEMPGKFSNGLAKVFGEPDNVLAKTRMMGYIDMTGRYVWPMQK